MTPRFTIEHVENSERPEWPLWRVVDRTGERAPASWVFESLAREHAKWLNAREQSS